MRSSFSMDTALENNHSRQLLLGFAFGGITLAFTAVCVLFAIPVGLLLLLLAPLAWVALRRSIRLSIWLAAGVIACALFVLGWWYPLYWLENGLSLLSAVVLYGVALFIIDHQNKKYLTLDRKSVV